MSEVLYYALHFMGMLAVFTALLSAWEIIYAPQRFTRWTNMAGGWPHAFPDYKFEIVPKQNPPWWHRLFMREAMNGAAGKQQIHHAWQLTDQMLFQNCDIQRGVMLRAHAALPLAILPANLLLDSSAAAFAISAFMLSVIIMRRPAILTD
jgi:hypothetical protein